MWRFKTNPFIPWETNKNWDVHTDGRNGGRPDVRTKGTLCVQLSLEHKNSWLMSGMFPSPFASKKQEFQNTLLFINLESKFTFLKFKVLFIDLLFRLVLPWPFKHLLNGTFNMQKIWNLNSYQVQRRAKREWR